MSNWFKRLVARSLKVAPHSTSRYQLNDSEKQDYRETITVKEMAAACFETNRYTDAIVLYKKALDADKNDVSAYMGVAFAYQQMQKWDEAEKNLSIVLRLKPDEIDAHYMQAKISAAQNHIIDAIKRFEELLSNAPEFEVAYADYSFLLFQTGQISKALSIIEAGLQRFPQNPDFYLISGSLNISRCRYDLALSDFKLALQISPNSIEVWTNLAVVYSHFQNWGDALRCVNEILRFDGKNVHALVNRGNIFLEQNRNNEALASFDDALQILPNNLEVLLKKSAVLVKMKQLDDALDSFEKILNVCKEDAGIWSNKSAVLIDLKRYSEALECAEHALSLDQLHLDALINQSAALLGLDQLQIVMPVLNKILEISPQNEIAFWQRAKVHQRYSEHELALFNFSQALKLQPELDGAHFDQGFSLLTVGQLSEGWKKYEYRWKCAPHLMENRNFKTPYWDSNSSLVGKTLLIFYEAGYGDTIQFVRYFKMFAGLGCKLIFQTQPPLKKLLSNFDPNVLVVAAHETLPAFDTQIALMSLPLVFNTTLETIPAEEKYLDAEHALPGVVSRWREKILNNGRKKIGLVWSGNPVHQQDTSRSISSEQFLRLVSDEFYFACLQKDIRPVDRSFLVLEKRVVEFSADLTDFVETAGLITNMDLVITVDTSIAHLAGALGKPVWVLLPFNADWRWLLNRSDSPWYPSMTLFRQKEIGNWDQVLDEVSARLKELR